MKKKVVNFLTCVILGGIANAQNVDIPDSNFKNALLAHGSSEAVNGVEPIIGPYISIIDADADGEISVLEAQNYTGEINVYGRSISDITGIEAFTNLTVLECGNNNFTTLNVSSNTALIELACSENDFTNLDVSANNALTVLSCSYNDLTTLNLSVNTLLTRLDCRNNSLTTLDLSANTALIDINCINNVMTSLDLSNNTALTSVQCGNNNLITLDVSENSELELLYCYNNNLTTLNVANGNNTTTYGEGLYGVYAENNPDLNCIQHDVGFTPTGITWTKDSTASWSDDCPENTSGIDENKSIFSIVPNPTSGLIKIDTEVEINKVGVFSASGQKVTSFKTKEFDISSLESGVYFLKVLVEGSLFVERIVKE